MFALTVSTNGARRVAVWGLVVISLAHTSGVHSTFPPTSHTLIIALTHAALSLLQQERQRLTCLFAAYILNSPSLPSNRPCNLCTSPSGTKNSTNAFWNTYPPCGPQPCTASPESTLSTAGCEPTVQYCLSAELRDKRTGRMVADSGDKGRSQNGVVGCEGEDWR